ncbi:beta-microseminoprotein-like isoform X1 [Arapaima gigas]
MKYLLLASLLCVLLPRCWAACYVPNGLKVLGYCQDSVDKTWHPEGSKWRNSACNDCTCDACCNAYTTPVRFPEDCMKEFDHVTCEYKVFKKNDRSQPCLVSASVGK